MKNFIEKKLKIKDYKITYFDSGKNNITAKVDSNLWTFVIQKEWKGFFDGEISIIEDAVSYFIKKWFNFAWNFFEERFFRYDWDLYQIMSFIEWNNLNAEEIGIDEIKNMSEYLGLFHAISEKASIKTDNKNKTFKDVDEMINLWEKLSKEENKHNNLFKKIKKIRDTIKIDTDLRKWILHWDPAFKNFIFDKDKKVVSIIDYEKMEYNNLVWDLVDMIRSLLQVKYYWKKEFEETIKSYEKWRKLSNLEKKNLKWYLKTMILNTCNQYFLSLFVNSWYCNNKWWEDDTLKKIQRCFSEIEKVELFFI